MDIHSWVVYTGFGIGIALVSVLIALFFISRKSQKTMNSLLTIMTEPERAKINDASNVLQTIMAGELDKIMSCFALIQKTLQKQIANTDGLKQELTVKTDALVKIVEDAIQKTAQTSGRLENTVGGLQNIVESDSWNGVQKTITDFSESVTKTMDAVTSTTSESIKKIDSIEDKINAWNEKSQTLRENLAQSFDTNVTQFQNLTIASEEMQERISSLAKSTADTFAQVKDTAANYEDTMENNTKILSSYLTKLDSFGKQSKKQLTGQMNSLTSTANVVGAQVVLAEASIENQIRKLTEAVETVMASATETESSVRNISSELTGLTNHFDHEIKDFATGVVSELKTVSGVANTTLDDTKTAANAFSESVRAMATGVRETLIEMKSAHDQLATQSAGLIKTSNETTAQLQPLTELISQYYAALPDLTSSSDAAGKNLQEIVSRLNEQIANIKATVNDSTKSVMESSTKLDELAGQSRQQMIDLMSDYAKAVETMQTLNKQMMLNRASSPMEAIKVAPSVHTNARISTQDFLTTCEREFDKMREQVIDLTRAMGSDIPDVVWKKYHEGDKKVFAKWMEKVLKATDKKQIRELIKSDSVFRSQATQFVRSFDKILTASRQTDAPDKLAAGLIRTELGQIYTALSANL